MVSAVMMVISAPSEMSVLRENATADSPSTAMTEMTAPPIIVTTPLAVSTKTSALKTAAMGNAVMGKIVKTAPMIADPAPLIAAMESV